MEPVFKVKFKEVGITDPEGLQFGQASVIIKMGDRSIVFRAATGEQGEEGPFPYVEVVKKEGEGISSSTGFSLTRESEFEALWKFLEAGCR